MTAGALSTRPEALGIDALTTHLLRLAERFTQVALLNRYLGHGPIYSPEVYELCSLVLVGAHFALQGGPSHDITLWRERTASVVRMAEAGLKRVQPEGPAIILPSAGSHPLVAALPPALLPGHLLLGEGGAHG